MLSWTHTRTRFPTGAARPTARSSSKPGQASDQEVRRAAFRQLGDWSPWLTGITELVVDRLADLDETITSTEVAQLLKAGGDGVLHDALARLVARDANDDHPGDPATGGRPDGRRVELLPCGATLDVREGA